MGIKDYLKAKKNKNTNNIVDTLNKTIKELEEYLHGLDNGTIHSNVGKLEDGEDKKFAQQMIAHERYYVVSSLESLKIATDTIKSHQIIDTSFVPKSPDEKTK